MFHFLAYHKATGAASTDQQMIAVTDAEFTIRNSNFIFTEPYKLLAAGAQGATITRANFFMPSWNAYSLFNIWPLILSADMAANPNMMELFDRPLDIPMNEEMQINNTDGASENVDAYVCVGTPDWNSNIPPGRIIGPVRMTSTVTGVIGSWVTGNALTAQQNLQNGVYAVVGAQCQGDDGLAFRLNFPKVRRGSPRKMRPGWLMQQAIGDRPTPREQWNPYFLGEWGRFHTFELPTIELYAVAADSVPMVLYLWLVFLGTDVGLLGG